MTKYYKILQGTMFQGYWVEPLFPLNIENLRINLETGLAIEIIKSIALLPAPWGTGIYKIDDEGNIECLSEDFDTSD